MKKIGKAVFILILLLSASSAWGQYTPVNGGENIADLLSPSFLGGGAFITSMESPASDVLNPAASGLKQRTTLDLSYFALAGLTNTAGDTGYQGHAANLGLSIPSKVGVFSFSGHFVHSPFTSMNLGTFGALDASFSKDLFPNFLVGAGIHTAVGFNTVADWALYAQLGFLHLPGDIGFMKDFTWGLSLQGLGKSFSPLAGFSGYPAPFTPVLGARFNLVRADKVTWGVLADVGFPLFQNVDFTVGSFVTLFDTVTISLSGHYDIVELTDTTVSNRSPIPGFGISVTFRTDFNEDARFLSDRGWNRSEVKPAIAAAPLNNGIWAFGAGVNIPLGAIDSAGPDVRIEYTEKQYISPNNDSTSDGLIIPLSIDDSRYIKGYTVKIYNDDGELVREIPNKEKRPENITFQNIIQRLGYVKSGIDIPENIRWDGHNNEGTTVEDGEYSFVIESWDDNGNVTETEPLELTIDSTDPEVTSAAPPESLIFSPNDDGQKDTLTITQSGSSEDEWQGEILNLDGDVVKTFQWNNGTPDTFEWDGKNDEGILVPDGVYTYRISSVDRAGNSSEAAIDNIIINTQATPITLNLDSSFISPDGQDETAQRSINFIPGIPVTRGIQEWSLTITDNSGQQYRVFEGELSVPEKIAFNGKNDSGNTLPEGEYYATLKVLYTNGNNPVQDSPRFTVDRTKPSANVTAVYTVFSPNGDGNKDTIEFLQDTSREDMWFGTIYNDAGDAVRTYTWIERADVKMTWDGYSADGIQAPDGEYSYILSATDKAGNHGTSNTQRFTLDTEDTPVLFSVDREAFSPNGDNIMDQLTLTPILERNQDIVEFVISIRNDSGSVVKTIRGRDRMQPGYIWNGIGDDGKRVSDGSYRAELNVLYTNGNNPVVQTRFFAVDTQYPKMELALEYTLFSPDGDGNRDTLDINHTASQEERWEGKIINSAGETVRTVLWQGRPSTFSWDGTDDIGNILPDGSYTYRISSEDKAGNTTSVESDEISIDTRATTLFLTVDSSGFSPNNDGFRDEITFRSLVNLTEGITSWTMELVHETDSVEYMLTGTGTPPEEIVWDGWNDNDRKREGSYTGRLTVEYLKGNRPVAESKEFLLDISPPKLEVTIDPVPFSPDNDGLDDELAIMTRFTDISGIKEWSLQISDPTGKPFYLFEGEGAPSDTLVWDGKSSEGELVAAAEDYPFEYVMEDVLGNTTSVRGAIPVDILVIRDGDRLKIRISSITFEPDNPRLILDDTEKGLKNQQILERLAEILNKYRNHQIRIEGHAVSVYWYDTNRAAQEEREELQPLSEKRAAAVKEALVEQGVDGRRISTLGLGGTEPVVPHSDLENRWKNRRVEFILIK